MIICGVDPGKSVGVAWWDSNVQRIPRCDTLRSLEELTAFLGTMKPDVIHMEAYLPRQGVTRQTDAPDQIGAVKSWAKENDCEVYTRSSTIKGWSTDDKLKALGWVGRSPHSRDALRHLLFGLCNTTQGRLYLGGQELLEKMVDSLDS